MCIQNEFIVLAKLLIHKLEQNMHMKLKQKFGYISNSYLSIEHELHFFCFLKTQIS